MSTAPGAPVPDSAEPNAPDSQSPDAETADPAVLTAEERETRRRRLAEVFGETIPEQTRDDAADPQAPDGAEEWLRRQVPPHHG